MYALRESHMHAFNRITHMHLPESHICNRITHESHMYAFNRIRQHTFNRITHVYLTESHVYAINRITCICACI